MKKKTILVCCLSLLVHGVFAQFRVNGRKVVFDASANTYMVSIPDENFGTDYQADIAVVQDSLWTDVTIDGTETGSGFVFRSVEPGKQYSIGGKRNGRAFNSYITFTSLPMVDLKGEFGYDYANGTIEIMVPSATETELSLIKAKWRGNSTNAPNKHKRNYKIKTLNEKGKAKDVSFLGMREDNNWILDAGQADMFRVRNRIATELWQDMGAKPYYSDKEPKAQNAVNGQVVELILNNSYAGVYSFTEAMDRKQLKLKKYDSKEGAFHGMLWKANDYVNSGFWNTGRDYDDNSGTWKSFEVKYPDIDDVCPTDYSKLYEAVDFVVSADDDTFREHVAEYFDLPLLIDYYVFINTISAVDNTAKNICWAIYDQAVDRKLTVAVWDLDMSVGGKWQKGTTPPAYVAPDYMLPIGANNIFYRLVKLNVDGFNEKVAMRYWQLRRNLFSEQSLKERYNAYYRRLANSGAAKREENRWSKDSDINGKELDFEREIEYISQWITTRLQCLDSGMFRLPTGIDEVNNEDMRTERIYNVQGQRLGQIPARGVYIVNGRKYAR